MNGGFDVGRDEATGDCQNRLAVGKDRGLSFPLSPAVIGNGRASVIFVALPPPPFAGFIAHANPLCSAGSLHSGLNEQL